MSGLQNPNLDLHSELQPDWQDIADPVSLSTPVTDVSEIKPLLTFDIP